MVHNSWLHLNLSFSHPKGWCCDRIQNSTRANEMEKDLKIVTLSATLPEGEPSRDCFVFLFKQKKKKRKKERSQTIHF